MKYHVIGLFLFLLVLPSALLYAQDQNSVEGDRQALVALYNATNGDNWSNNSGWLNGNPSDDWYGIEVDANGRVTEVNLQANNLDGSLVAELGNLTQCRIFDVRINQLGGDLPSEMSGMTSIVKMQLAGSIDIEPNYTSGGYHVGKSPDASNRFTGGLPPEWSTMTNIEEFWLERQGQMSGTLPPEWSTWTEIKFFSIYGEFRDYTSGFTGSLPPEWDTWINIVFFTAGRNAISGNLPSEWSTWTEIKVFWVGGSNLNTRPPDSWVSMSKMRMFFADRTRPEGDFPAHVLDGSWPNLITFSFDWPEGDQYGFTGSLPTDWSGVADINQFAFSGHKLTGGIPKSIATDIESGAEIFNLGWQQDDYGFTGELPQDWSEWRDSPSGNRYIRFRDNNFTGPIPSILPRQRDLYFQENDFSSADPQSFIDWDNALGSAARTCDISNNRLTPKDIEPAIGQVAGFSYGNQKPFDQSETRTSPAGSDVTIDKSHQAHSGNSYQWTKDGVDLEGETSNILALNNIDAGDEGAYRLKITHPSFSQTFISEPVQLEIGQGGGSVPGTSSLVSPGDGATGVSVTPTLDWNSVSSAETYRLQVATGSDFSSTVTDVSGLTATQYEASLDFNTTYYWRVQASNSEGSGNWSEVREFTTVEQAPVQPTLISPANGATSISTATTMDWDPAERAETYHLLVSESDTFTETVIDVSGISSSTTSYQVDGLDNSVTYYWKVAAVNSGGSSESAVWNFTTEEAALTQPQLAEPADGATDQPTTLSLSWNAVDGGETYRLQVADNDAFQSPVSDQNNIKTTDFTVDNLTGGTVYYWRVKAISTAGESSWSEIRSFTTEFQIPSEPVLSSPEDGATGLSINPTLNWESTGQEDTYRVQVSSVQDFSTTVFDQNDITESSQQISGLENSATYYWRVQASNAAGSSDWSASREFTTSSSNDGTILDAPSVISPSDEEQNVSLTPVLQWSDEGADYYILHLDTPETPDLILEAEVNGTQYEVTEELVPERVHKWRVRGVKNGVEGEWSPVFAFTTGEESNTNPAPNAPTLLSPSDNADNISLAPTFSWNSVDADHYVLQVSNTESTTVVIETETQATTFTVDQDLNPETLYSWRVRAVKDGVEGEWSSSWEFSTEAETTDEMETSLGQNYPNPFNPSTQIRFSLAETQQVSLKVYDTVGRLVATIVEGSLTAGTYERTFRADNLASGVYFLRFVTENRILTSQMTLMK